MKKTSKFNLSDYYTVHDFYTNSCVPFPFHNNEYQEDNLELSEWLRKNYLSALNILKWNFGKILDLMS